MTNNYSAGGYIDAWCTRCKLELVHTIVAMVANAPKRVKCNTCGSLHNFRHKASEQKKIRPKRPAKKATSREINYDEYMSRLTDGDFSGATKYRIDGDFEKEEMIDHSKFGIGIVLYVIQNDKIEVLFKEGPKLLVQNKESV